MTDPRLEEIFTKYRDLPGPLIVVLQEIQKLLAYLPTEALVQASRYFRIPLSEIYSVATFYTQFKFSKPGRTHIKVCHGTACHINGAVKVSDALEERLGIGPDATTADGAFSLENVACLGCCSLSPVVMAGDKVFGKLDRTSAKKLVVELGKSL